MLIAQIEPAHASRGRNGYYRTYSPGVALAAHDDVYVVDLTNVHRKRDLLLDRADLVVLNMVCDADLLPAIAKRAARGLPTVYEVNDDIANVDVWNPAPNGHTNTDRQVLFRMLVRACCGAQFATPELLRIYGRLATKTALFPSHMTPPVGDDAHASERARTALGVAHASDREDGRIVVGWGGQADALNDIATIAATLANWVARRSDAVLHLMCSEPIWHLFDLLDESKKRRFAEAPLERYHDFVAGLDIGIAPLEDTSRNRCRSDVQVLEYALHGVVPVARSLPPFRSSIRHGSTGFLFDDPVGMTTCLDQLANDPALRARMARAAQDYVLQERSEQTRSLDRLAFYRSLNVDDLAPPRRRDSLAPPCDAAICIPSPRRSSGSFEASPSRRSSGEMFAALAQLEGAHVEARHLTFEPTRYETLVQDALEIGEEHSKRDVALEWLREAARLESTAYQPHLYGAPMSPCPIEWLQDALKRNPNSVNARVALAEQLALFGQVQSTVASLLAAVDTHPGWDIPYQKLAEFMSKWNKPEEAKHFFETAAALRQPYLDLVDL